MNSVYMKDITWREFEEKKNRAVILPVGSTEQHSYHLPFCTDSAIAEGISVKLAERIDGIVMPTLCYGYKSKPMSGGGPLFQGTIDLSAKTLISVAEDILEELCMDGVNRNRDNCDHYNA